MAKKKKSKSLRCPTCGTVVLPDEREMPFCSERCRTIDLGKWASGAYRISSPVIDPDVLEGLEERHRSGRLPEDDDSAEKSE